MRPHTIRPVHVHHHPLARAQFCYVVGRRRRQRLHTLPFYSPRFNVPGRYMSSAELKAATLPNSLVPSVCCSQLLPTVDLVLVACV